MKRYVMPIALVVLPIIVGTLGASCVKSNPGNDYADLMAKMYGKMRIGDWALYYFTETMGVRVQVVEKDGDTIVLDRRNYIGNSPAQGSYRINYDIKKIRYNILNGFDTDGVIRLSPPVVTTETVEAADQTFTCAVYTVKNSAGKIIKTYISDKVPLDGVVMVKREDKVIRRLMAYGFAGEKIILPTFQ